MSISDLDPVRPSWADVAAMWLQVADFNARTHNSNNAALVLEGRLQRALLSGVDRLEDVSSRHATMPPIYGERP